METGKKVILHHFPGSFYSQKVFMALEEKGVKYEENLVNILFGEQLKPEFLQKNKQGLVPVLEVDGVCYAESEYITDTLDTLFKSGPTLVPEVGSSLGDAVRDFRSLLYDIPVDQITYGVIANRELMKDRSCEKNFPHTFNREGIKNKFLGEAKKLRTLRETCDPSMSEAIDVKIERAVRRSESFLDKDITSRILDDLESVFDKLEQRLQQTKRENPDVSDTWLVGPTYTAADIAAVTLFSRLEFVGVAPRYFSNSVRPTVNEYYTRMQGRQSVKKMLANIERMKSMFIKMKLKSFGLKALKVGLVVGLIGAGYMCYKSFTRGAKE